MCGDGESFATVVVGGPRWPWFGLFWARVVWEMLKPNWHQLMAGEADEARSEEPIEQWRFVWEVSWGERRGVEGVTELWTL